MFVLRCENIVIRVYVHLMFSVCVRADCCIVDEPGQIPHVGGLSHFGTVSYHTECKLILWKHVGLRYAMLVLLAVCKLRMVNFGLDMHSSYELRVNGPTCIHFNALYVCFTSLYFI